MPIYIDQALNDAKARKLKASLTYLLALCLMNSTVFCYLAFDTDYTLLKMALGIVFLGFTISLLVVAESLFTPSANEILAHDHRAPVLYLRPFDIDLHVIADTVDPHLSHSGLYETPIEDLLRPLNAIGPVISIADPNASSVHIAGSYQENLDTTAWKSRVITLLKQASLVVFVCGNTPGIEWEIQQIKKFVPLTSLLLFIPPFSGSFARKQDWQQTEQKQYEDFRNMFSLYLGITLPMYSRSIHFIGFDASHNAILPFDKKPIDTVFDNKEHVSALAQTQLFRIISKTRPAISLQTYPIYGQLARHLRFAFSLLMFIASVPVSIYVLYS